ncbi:MAG: right-handed parallel beta-helix repeat-containing protein [Planctomycetaceae bacterium]
MVDPDTVNTTLNLTYAGNTMNSNLGNGINLGISNGQHLVLAMPSGNTIGTSGAGNGGMGVRLDVSGTSSFAATIGTTGQIANNFGSNHDAGFGISMSDNSGNSVNPLLQNTLTVVNSNFTGTTDGSDANFSGQGLGVGLTENAVLTSMTLGDTTANNTTFSNGNVDGIGLFVDSSARVDNVIIRHVAANNNSNDGMNFFRQGDAQIVNTAVTNSSFNNNRGNGVELTAAARDVVDTYTFTDTTFNSNTDNGMQLNVIADGDLNVTVTRGTFTGNGNSGIEATRNADTTDTPEVILNVQDSTISSNSGDGIQMFDVRDGGNPFAVYDLTVNNTLISLNGRDGIHLRDPGISSITNNRILNNRDDGIDIRVDTNGGAITEIYGNTIQFNDSDGVQLVVQGDSAVGDFTVGGTGVGQANQILDNGGRGILLITAGGSNISSTTTTADFSGNTIARNQLEGIYVVNTAANDQALEANVDNVTSDAMLTTDQLQNRPRTFLTINANTINSNGKTLDAGDFIGATGIVVRVGSSNASTSYTDNGGTFASGRGGVGATITGNTLHGNYGADVTFAPFISTTPPDQTQGTWSATEFTVDSFISDPLARLDLVFNGNTGDGLLASNPTASTAFYDNPEGTFKSRTTDATDPGPFNADDRARNATRLGARTPAPFNLPTTPGGNSDNFNYSGVGGYFNAPLTNNTESTFRVNLTGGNTFGAGVGFGSGVSIGGDFGEAPFIWATLP